MDPSHRRLTSPSWTVLKMAPDSNPPFRGQLKVPKGTRDLVGQELLLRDYILDTIRDVLRRHGGVPLDTPVFELRHILSEKYGEDSKLIYDLEDQGGELCSLRYDLTVPFARWLAMNKQVKQIKRYQMAKVYRRDQPAMTRGRFREFFQCDFDIAGTYDPMIPDAEILRIIVEVFDALKLDVTIKLNHRQILDGLFETCGVPEDKVRAISSSVDKLDKIPWPEVRQEMVQQKGLSDEVADEVGQYVLRSSTLHEMLEILRWDHKLDANEKVQAGLDDMALLLSGLIYEVIPNPHGCQSQVGSIAAGGRYDGLVGMFSKQAIPCVGISFGIDRIYTLLDAQLDKGAPELANETDVYIVALGGKDFDGLFLERLNVARELWDVGIATEFTAKVKPRRQQQLDASKNSLVMVILGEEELRVGQVRLKVVSGRGETDARRENTKGRLILRERLVEEVRQQLLVLRGGSCDAIQIHRDDVYVFLLCLIPLCFTFFTVW